MRRIYSAYTGTGSVYAVIATHKNYSSAYVPIFTYACSPLLYPDSCQVLSMSYHFFTTVLFCFNIMKIFESYLKTCIFLCEIYILRMIELCFLFNIFLSNNFFYLSRYFLCINFVTLSSHYVPCFSRCVYHVFI